MRNSFALIGAAGYVAPRHMRAIKETGGDLKAALDPADSVGIIDRYFEQAAFFVEFERFDRHLDLLHRRGESVDYISICSPNYLHDAHVRFAMRSGADAICEKPLVLNPWNLDGLAEMEECTGRRVYSIMQLRQHPAVTALKRKVENGPPDRVYEVDLSYITARGRWYFVSWKGDEAKSGGIATNIGVHFYDMLSFVFGPLKRNVVHYRATDRAAGYLEYQKARVRWFLSVRSRDLRKADRAEATTFRSIVVDGEELEFSDGFNNLHTESYRDILANKGIGLDEVRSCIETVSYIRSARVEPARDAQHPLLVNLRDESRYEYGKVA